MPKQSCLEILVAMDRKGDSRRIVRFRVNVMAAIYTLQLRSMFFAAAQELSRLRISNSDLQHLVLFRHLDVLEINGQSADDRFVNIPEQFVVSFRLRNATGNRRYF